MTQGFMAGYTMMEKTNLNPLITNKSQISNNLNFWIPDIQGLDSSYTGNERMCKCLKNVESAHYSPYKPYLHYLPFIYPAHPISIFLTFTV